MRTAEDSRRYIENWQDEIDSAAEYRAMAHGEPDASLAKVDGNLARMEEAHITFWEAKLRLAGVEVGPRRPSWRSRVLGWIARRLGPDLVLTTMVAREAADQNHYVTQPEATGTRMPPPDGPVERARRPCSRGVGIEPSKLGGSAWAAAVSSFLLFSVGAIVPILPFLVTRGNAALV